MMVGVSDCLDAASSRMMLTLRQGLKVGTDPEAGPEDGD